MVQVMASTGTSEPQAGRSQQRGQETREKVIQAAAACVAEEGFAAANTNRIVERAGVTWGVLQHHFGDKSGLLDAVLERGMEELEAGFEAITIEDDDIHKRVARVVDDELVEVWWERPADALVRLDRGDLAAIAPTISFLTALSKYRHVEDAFAGTDRGVRREFTWGVTTF